MATSKKIPPTISTFESLVAPVTLALTGNRVSVLKPIAWMWSTLQMFIWAPVSATPGRLADFAFPGEISCGWGRPRSW